MSEADHRKKLRTLEDTVGYHFRDESLLVQAMTHSSYANEHGMGREGCNERLEFLGDAVLELASSEFLYQNYPDSSEGEMTKLRASIVCEPTLADCAASVRLADCLLLGRGEESMGGRLRASIVSDAMEAFIGAISLDGGYERAREFVWKFVMNDIENRRLFYDSKTILQEMVQHGEMGELCYELIGTEGPEHRKTYTCEARIGGLPCGTGTGRSKKLAEQSAAYEAIRKLRESGHVSEED